MFRSRSAAIRLGLSAAAVPSMLNAGLRASRPFSLADCSQCKPGHTHCSVVVGPLKHFATLHSWVDHGWGAILVHMYLLQRCLCTVQRCITPSSPCCHLPTQPRVPSPPPPPPLSVPCYITISSPTSGGRQTSTIDMPTRMRTEPRWRYAVNHTHPSLNGPPQQAILERFVLRRFPSPDGASESDSVVVSNAPSNQNGRRVSFDLCLAVSHNQRAFFPE